MTEWVLSLVKSVDGTGSTQLLLAGVVPGVLLALVWPRKRAWTLRWFVATGLIYLMLTIPIVANTLAAPLQHRDAHFREPSGPLDALVIFDGDNRRGRLRAARAAIEASSPDVIWVLGVEPEWFQLEMPGEGIPLDRVRFDTSTGTTRAQVEWTARDRSSQPRSSVAVVVSRLQAARVAGIASALRIANLPIISAPVNREPATDGIWRFVPSGPAWRVSRDAIYEHAALAYYARNGWIDR